MKNLTKALHAVSSEGPDSLIFTIPQVLYDEHYLIASTYIVWKGRTV
jgi:hypothetical protein